MPGLEPAVESESIKRQKAVREVSRCTLDSLIKTLRLEWSRNLNILCF